MCVCVCVCIMCVYNVCVCVCMYSVCVCIMCVCVCVPEEHQPSVAAPQGAGDALLRGGPPVLRPEDPQLARTHHSILR